MVIIGGIRIGAFTPTEGGAVAVVYALIVGFFLHRELTWKKLVHSLSESGMLVGVIMLVIAAAQMYSWALISGQIPQQITQALLAITDNPLLILLFINILLLLVGTVIETNAALIVFVPLLLPVATAVGIDPVHLGLVMVVNLGIGLLTPPVGLCLLVSCKIGKISISQAIPAMLPWFGICLAFLAGVTYLPVRSAGSSGSAGGRTRGERSPTIVVARVRGVGPHPRVPGARRPHRPIPLMQQRRSKECRIWRTGSTCPSADADREWWPADHDVLVREVAREYGAWISHSPLADRIQASSGISSREPGAHADRPSPRQGRGRRRAARRAAAHLLGVTAEGLIGDDYPVVPAGTEVRTRERGADQDRLEGYRSSAHEASGRRHRDGAWRHCQLDRPRQARTRAAAAPAAPPPAVMREATCPHCFMVVPVAATCRDAAVHTRPDRDKG